MNYKIDLHFSHNGIVKERSKSTMNSQYETSRAWFNENWPCCIRVDIEWTCYGYDYPDHVIEWIKNDSTNWRKINDENGGTYEYFARLNER